MGRERVLCYVLWQEEPYMTIELVPDSSDTMNKHTSLDNQLST